MLLSFSVATTALRLVKGLPFELSIYLLHNLYICINDYILYFCNILIFYRSISGINSSKMSSYHFKAICISFFVALKGINNLPLSQDWVFLLSQTLMVLQILPREIKTAILE